MLFTTSRYRRDILQANIIRAIGEIKAIKELPTITRISTQFRQGKDKANVSRALAELVAQRPAPNLVPQELGGTRWTAGTYAGGGVAGRPALAAADP